MSLRADSVAAESLRRRGDTASWFSRSASTESCWVLSPRQSSTVSGTPTAHFHVAPRRDAVDVDRIEMHRQRGLELRAERVAHLLERRSADDMEPERRPHQSAHRARGEAPRDGVERRDKPAAPDGTEVAAPGLGPRVLGVAVSDLTEVAAVPGLHLPEQAFRLVLLVLLD